MVKITVGIDGMMCGMCESHVNEAVRNHFKVKKVTASHTDKNAVILAEQEIPRDELEAVIKETGYDFVDMTVEPYEKKKLFGKK